MQKKGITYFLIVMVAGIWGVVFYRVFSAVGGDETSYVIPKSKSVLLATKTAEDTFKLINNYRDPFLGKGLTPYNYNSGQTSQNSIVKKKEPPKPKEPEIPMDWSFINYMGTIHNKDVAKKVGLVRVNGSDRMVEEGDTWKEVKFVKYYKDSVKVEFNKKTTYIKKHS